jgi:predicted kinase
MNTLEERPKMLKFEDKMIVLVGNIGSGKTTYCKKLVEEGYIVIARDKFRYMIGNGGYIFDTRLEEAVWESEMDMFRRFMRTGVNIVIDEVGVSKYMRLRYTGIAKTFGYKTCAIVLPKLSKKEAVDRRMQDPHGQPDRKLWEGVWDKFNKIFEEPTKAEMFDEVVFLEQHRQYNKY